MKKRILACLLLAIIPGLGVAHPGHGHTDDFTLIHYFLEPEHLAFTLCVIAVGLLFFLGSRKKEQMHN